MKLEALRHFFSKNFLPIIAFYLAVLILLSRYVSLGTAGILETLFIMACAFRWKVRGGVISAILASALLLFSYASTPHVFPFYTILTALITYFVVGVVLGKVWEKAEKQEVKLREEEDRARDLSEQLSTYLDLVQVMIVVLDRKGLVTMVNRKTCEKLGYRAEEIIGKNWFEQILPQTVQDQVQSAFKKLIQGKGEPVEYYENPVRTRQGQERIIAWHNAVLRDASGTIIGTISAGEDITEIKNMERKLTEQLHTLSILYRSAEKLLTEDLNLQRRAQTTAQICVEEMGVQLAWVGYAEPEGQVKILAQYPQDHPYTQNLIVRWDETPYGQGPVGRSIRTGTPQVIEDISLNHRFEPWKERARRFGFRTVAAFPLLSFRGTFGTLILYTGEAGFFTSERQNLIQALAHLAASVLENARLFEETQNNLKKIQALRSIDTAIAGSADPRVAFSIALDELTRQLGIDAADILLFNPHTLTIECAAHKGFRGHFDQKATLRLGESLAGRVALEQRMIAVRDLLNSWRREIVEVSEEHARGFERFIAEEGFLTYYGVPLIAKGQFLGVLEVFQRTPIEETEEWMEFLEMLANQMAIAIDNATLLQKLGRTNLELTRAYDATLEGWARVLELRDRETEGHSQRVTEMTIEISRKIGVREEDLVHIRRGALLHDIGKLGIPDNILLKPGKLTPEEWEAMKKHPVYAYQMLSRIEYLRPALDIPYCHHEKWDGSGYPRGLRGEEIPLAARIFAVVDVFDALTSNRPYRKAWTKDEALEYIRKERGKHFDPQVVDTFFEYLQGEASRETSSQP